MIKGDSFLSGRLPLAKAVTDSDIRAAWSRQYPSTGPTYAYVDALLLDESAVVVCEGDRKWKVPFSIDDGSVTFDPEERKEVQLDWVEKRRMRQYTLSVVYAPNERDAHNDTMNEDELEAAAWRALSKNVAVGVMHEPDTAGAGRVVESYISRKAFSMRDISGKVQKVPRGSWLMGIVWEDTPWQAIQKGLITGLSLQGFARSEPTSKSDVSWNNRMATMPPNQERSLPGIFTNVIFPIPDQSSRPAHAVRDYDPGDLERTDEDTFSPDREDDRRQQDAQGQRMAAWTPGDDPNLRRRMRVSFDNVIFGRDSR